MVVKDSVVCALIALALSALVFTLGDLLHGVAPVAGATHFYTRRYRRGMMFKGTKTPPSPTSPGRFVLPPLRNRLP